jgi:[ribosomal protein S18]-alanine N-acetyltransferase
VKPDPFHLAAIHARSITPAWSEAALRDLLAQPGVWAEAEADGFVLMRQAGDEAEVLTLAVLPEARRRGRARSLMQAALNSCRARGVRDVFLEVAADNTGARALYQALGMREGGRRRGYYARTAGPPVDALILTLNLAPPLP